MLIVTVFLRIGDPKSSPKAEESVIDVFRATEATPNLAIALRRLLKRTVVKTDILKTAGEMRSIRRCCKLADQTLAELEAGAHQGTTE